MFGTSAAEIVLYPGSGTAAWEASLANTLSPGDRVLAFNIGHFSHQYAECARRLGMVVDEVDVEWGNGVPIEALKHALDADRDRAIRAVLIVHNETSTGVTSQIGAIRMAIDRALTIRHCCWSTRSAVSRALSSDSMPGASMWR